MEEVSLKVSELYELKALALGLDWVETVDGKPKRTNIVQGFINEPGLSEGVKRAVNRIGKAFEDQVALINVQRQSIVSDETLTEESKRVKEEELLNDTITISIEKVDFKKVEDLSLKNNYQFLYDKIFK